MKLILYYIFVSFVSFDDDLVAHPGTRTWCHAFAVVGVALPLSSQTATAGKKKYLDYDYQVPAEGVKPSQRRCRARDGVLVD